MDAAARIANIAENIDDPCDEGGFDQFCRNARGELCRFNAEFCKAPDYVCIGMLRDVLAAEYFAKITKP